LRRLAQRRFKATDAEPGQRRLHAVDDPGALAGMEHANNEAQERKRSAGPVRTEQAGRLAGPLHKEHLAALVKTLLLEIAAALASGKVANDQDHG
jgi:hypothetical protein